MNPTETAEVIGPVVALFDSFQVPYFIGGSLASSAHGVSRSTLDVDLVADLNLDHVEPLVSALQQDYYIDAGMITEAISRKSCFNVIHLASVLKIDVFAVKDRQYDRQSLTRAERIPLTRQPGAAEFLVASPEDIILNKLEWFRIGDEISERQWNDVLGVMRLQREALDKSYLQRWATEIGVKDLLDKAWHQADSES